MMMAMNEDNLSSSRFSFEATDDDDDDDNDNEGQPVFIKIFR